MLLLLCLLPIVTFAADPIAKTSFGSIRGYEKTASNGETVRIFKAVPFAAPPVGELRWQLPQNPKKWEGVIDGREYSPACLSNSTSSASHVKNMAEDCLYLNVFVHGSCKGDCPITMLFHGGGMNFDSAVYYNDTYLIDNFASKGIMLVVPAFRLGYLAIFDLGDGAKSIPRNLGVHDALQALSFVAEEAASFGGDSKSITLMGHSYGSILAGVLTYSPLRRERVEIKRLIMMSPSLQFNSPEKIKWLTSRLVNKTSCTTGSSKQKLDCLRQKDAVDLLRLQTEMEIEDKSAPWSMEDTLLEYILFEGPLLPFANFTDLLSHPPGVDIVIGSTIGEMDLPTDMKAQKKIPVSHPGTLFDARNPDELEKIRAAIVETEDGKWHAPPTELIYFSTYKIAQSVINGGNKAFVYSYAQDSPHVYHTDDYSYIAGIHMFERDANEKVIAQFYPELFANFSIYGVPSPDWTPTNRSDSYFSIAVDLKSGRRPTMQLGYESEVIQYWEKKAPKIDKILSDSTCGEKSSANLFKELNQPRSISTIDETGETTSLFRVLPLFFMGVVGALIIVAMITKSRRNEDESIRILSHS